MKRNQPIQLSGAHALITGAARGIGFATARRLVRSGARVTLWDLDADALKQASEELAAEHAGARITTEALDITEWATLADALGRSTSQLGPIDILINNAGHLAPGRLEDQAPETWMKTIEVNVQAVIYLSRLVVPSMYARRRGHIVNISSAAGTIGVPKLAV
jgi:3-oxoacyl-[acyl-carrier protein] reductase